MKVIAFLILLLPSYVVANENSGSVGLNIDPLGYVLHGYDPVSYFDENPREGDASFQAEYGQMRFKFVSENNLERFLQTPSSYLPAYGGYCSFGVRMGSKFDIDPEAYEIVDGKLYMLLNRATEELWLEDKERNIQIANRLWPSIEAISPLELQGNQ